MLKAFNFNYAIYVSKVRASSFYFMAWDRSKQRAPYFESCNQRKLVQLVARMTAKTAFPKEEKRFFQVRRWNGFGDVDDGGVSGERRKEKWGRRGRSPIIIIMLFEKPSCLFGPLLSSQHSLITPFYNNLCSFHLFSNSDTSSKHTEGHLAESYVVLPLLSIFLHSL